MADDNVQDLTEQLLADDELLQQFQEDPAGVIRDAGIDLDDEQEERLLGENWLEKELDEIRALLRNRGITFWL